MTGDPKYDEEDLVVNDCTFEMVMEDCEEWIGVTEPEKGSKKDIICISLQAMNELCVSIESG